MNTQGSKKMGLAFLSAAAVIGAAGVNEVVVQSINHSRLINQANFGQANLLTSAWGEKMCRIWQSGPGADGTRLLVAQEVLSLNTDGTVLGVSPYAYATARTPKAPQ